MKMRIIKKEIDFVNSAILFDEPISKGTFSSHWRVYSGEWWVEDGWLTGRNHGNFPGMVFVQGDFPGDVIVDFEARTVLPCTHDINFMWNGSWDETRNERGVAYVAGLQGWWDGKVGIEKSPDYKLNAGTPLFNFQPGRTYYIQGGSIQGHCFIFVDGCLLLEVTDPDPIDSKRYTKVGFEAYCSHIQIRKVQIRRIAWHPIEPTYVPEFK
jgi:hypothetical protein